MGVAVTIAATLQLVSQVATYVGKRWVE